MDAWDGIVLAAKIVCLIGAIFFGLLTLYGVAGLGETLSERLEKAKNGEDDFRDNTKYDWGIDDQTGERIGETDRAGKRDPLTLSEWMAVVQIMGLFTTWLLIICK